MSAWGYLPLASMHRFPERARRARKARWRCLVCHALILRHKRSQHAWEAHGLCLASWNEDRREPRSVGKWFTPVD